MTNNDPMCTCGHKRSNHIFLAGCSRCGKVVCPTFKLRDVEDEFDIPAWVNGD